MIKIEKLPPDILTKLPDAARVLEQDSDVIFAYLFGGLADKVIKPLSDVDLAVYIKEINDLAEFKMQLFDKLTDALGTGELDLVILNTAPVSLAGRILQKRVVLSDKEPFRRHVYESVTLREFFDFRIKEDIFFKRRYGIG
ncbi:MAG: nucleotidyltransferase domain-containing protein [Nitrospirae bacterium]|nr:nucleotidyltransferase domain-containing protein [Nitrospirota bacterium]